MGGGESGKSILMAQHDDGDDDSSNQEAVTDKEWTAIDGLKTI